MLFRSACEAAWSLSERIRSASPELLGSTAVLCVEKMKFAPKLAEFLEIMAQVDPSSRAKAGPAQRGCPRCQGNIFIEFAVWRGTSVDLTTCRCPCSGGLEPAAVARQWERLDPRIDRVIFGDGRALEASERGCLGGSGATARYTPSPERLDPHRAQRQRQIREIGRAHV